MQTSPPQPPHTLHHPWRSSFTSRWGMCDLNTHMHTQNQAQYYLRGAAAVYVLLKEFHWFVKLTRVKVCTCVCRRIVIGWLNAPKREDSDVIRTNTTLTVSAVVSQWLLNFQNKPTCLHPTHPSEAPTTIVDSTLFFFPFSFLETGRRLCSHGVPVLLWLWSHGVNKTQILNRLYWLMEVKYIENNPHSAVFI